MIRDEYTITKTIKNSKTKEVNKRKGWGFLIASLVRLKQGDYKLKVSSRIS